MEEVRNQETQISDLHGPVRGGTEVKVIAGTL